FLSLVVRHLPSSPRAVRAGLDLLLRRKALVVESVAAQRHAILSDKYPELRPQLQELVSLKVRLARETLAGPGTEGVASYRTRLGHMQAERDQLEERLAQQLPEVNLEQVL